MPTYTTTSTYTRTHTAVYLTEVILGAIGDILAHLGIDLTYLYSNWERDEAAIKKWIEEESLKEVILECYRPDGTVRPVIEFPVSYQTTGRADIAFTEHRAALARYRAKIDSVPRGTTFRLFCTFRKSHTPMPGWSAGTRASTSGLNSMSFGTLASAPHGNVGMRYLH